MKASASRLWVESRSFLKLKHHLLLVVNPQDTFPEMIAFPAELKDLATLCRTNFSLFINI